MSALGFLDQGATSFNLGFFHEAPAPYTATWEVKVWPWEWTGHSYPSGLPP